MNRLVVFSAVAAVVFAVSSKPAEATTFFADHFNYADGELTINDGTGDDVSGGLWVPHSGETFDDNLDVVGGQVEILNSGSEDANRDTGTFNSAGSTWYYGALITVNDMRADPSTESINNDYFAHFFGPSFAFRGRAYLDDPNVADPNKFSLGLSATSGGQVAKWGSDLDFGTQYKVMVSFEFDTGESKLWVDPVDENSTSITDTNAAAIGSFVSGLALRQDFISPGTPNNQIWVDSVAIGNEFGDVMRDLVIPEPSSMLLAMAGLFGLGTIRKR